MNTTDPHTRAHGDPIEHVPLTVVLNPKVHRPPADDPRREEYDAGLRIVMHLCMILSGVITIALLTMMRTEAYMMVGAEGLVPGAIQEVGDFILHL